MCEKYHAYVRELPESLPLNLCRIYDMEHAVESQSLTMNLVTSPLPPPAPRLSSLPMLIMTRFIAKEGLTARILIFTTQWSLRLTRHVEAFKMVESLVD